MSGEKGPNLPRAAFPCTQCARSFTSATAVAEHRRSKHPVSTTASAIASNASISASKASNPCTIPGCRKVFSSPEAREQHLHSAAHRSKRAAAPQNVGKTASSSNNNSSMAHKTGANVVGTTPFPTSSQTKMENEALSPNTDQNQPREETLLETHVMYNIKDCYLIATPRKGGGQPVVSPLMLDVHQKDFNLALLVSSPALLRPPTPDAASLGSCNSCDFQFTTWDSFSTHFYHSLCVTTVPRSDAEEAFVASQLTGNTMTEGDETTSESLLRPRKGKELVQVTKPKKTNAPKTSKDSKTGKESTLVKESQKVEQPQKGKKPKKYTDSKKAETPLEARKLHEIAEPSKVPEPKAEIIETQVINKWTNIPQGQQLAALTNLTSCCHSRTILAANKYPSDTTQVNFTGDGVTPVLLGSPTYDAQNAKRSAVALDCEMVCVGESRVSEVARISAIDYLTGEVLIDTFVQPTQPVKDWGTRWSGITEEAMNEAIAQGKALNGWPEARASLFKHIDASTILVGQSLQYDLIALGIRHQKVVDSAFLTSAAVGRKVKKRWGLKDLCNQLLGVEIRNDDNAGHDSVEDSFAAREVVLWCIEHQSELKRWGKKQRIEYYGKQKEIP
jgi:DNA polymerase III epsilon subunit-like protein